MRGEAENETRHAGFGAPQYASADADRVAAMIIITGEMWVRPAANAIRVGQLLLTKRTQGRADKAG